MREKSVKIKKTESLLQELIPEALSSMVDSRVKSVTVTEVDCSKGKYDAIVYVYESGLTDREKNEILNQLKKVSSKIKSYCLASTGWYKCPNFTFRFDQNVEKMSRMEDLFEKIKSKGNEDE
jgi:ribosome-binding factor A